MECAHWVIPLDRIRADSIVWSIEIELSARRCRAFVRGGERGGRSHRTHECGHPDTLSLCSDRLQRRLSLDFTRRLSDGILLINDKVSMAHSLEARMPFLDRRLLDFASVLPSTMKIRGGQEKYVLSLLGSLLPARIARRRKFGLGYPKCALLKEPVRSFSEQVLLDSAEPGPFRRKSVEGVLQQVRAGRRESARLLWMLLTVQCWWNEFF
jgi:asparagine synthase (glutamine-hydrolysing)